MHEIQKKIIDLIDENNGDLTSYSLRNIGVAIDIGEKPQIIAHHLARLQKKGFIREDRLNEKKYVTSTQPMPDIVNINLYECKAECGPNGGLGEDNITDSIPMSAKAFNIVDPNDYFLISAKGMSMYPLIKNGDLVLAKKQETANNDDLVIVVHNDMPKIKKVGVNYIDDEAVYSLISINKEFNDEEVDENKDELRIAGVVKGIIRNY